MFQDHRDQVQKDEIQHSAGEFTVPQFLLEISVKDKSEIRIPADNNPMAGGPEPSPSQSLTHWRLSIRTKGQ
jgi:hypothetical protein